MIVIGLTGGMGQGKSTVGGKLRELAGVDYKADLEFSYPISEVANDWIETWPKPMELPADKQIEQLANELLAALPAILQRRTGRTAEYQRLAVKDDPKSRLVHDRLLVYLHEWIALSEEEREVQMPLPIAPANKALHRSLLQWLGGGMITLVHPNIWADVIDRRIKELENRGYALLTVGGIRYEQDMAMIRGNRGLILKVIRPNTISSSDVTESAMQHVVADIELINNGSLEQLYAAVEKLWADLQSGLPDKQYSATRG